MTGVKFVFNSIRMPIGPASADHSVNADKPDSRPSEISDELRRMIENFMGHLLQKQHI